MHLKHLKYFLILILIVVSNSCSSVSDKDSPYQIPIKSKKHFGQITKLAQINDKERFGLIQLSGRNFSNKLKKQGYSKKQILAQINKEVIGKSMDQFIQKNKPKNSTEIADVKQKLNSELSSLNTTRAIHFLRITYTQNFLGLGNNPKKLNGETKLNGVKVGYRPQASDSEDIILYIPTSDGNYAATLVNGSTHILTKSEFQKKL